jgi:hypothetical protein
MRLRLTREENFDGLGSSRLEAHPGQLLTPWADREYATGHSFRRNVRCAEGKPIKRLPNHEVAWSVYGSSRTRGQDPCIGIRGILQ